MEITQLFAIELTKFLKEQGQVALEKISKMRPPTSLDLHSPDFSMAKFYEKYEAITTENETEFEGLTTGIETDGDNIGKRAISPGPEELSGIESDSEFKESKNNIKKELSDAISLSYSINLDKFGLIPTEDQSDPGNNSSSN